MIGVARLLNIWRWNRGKNMREKLRLIQTGNRELIHGIDTVLVICTPFLSEARTDKMKCRFCFMMPDDMDMISVLELSKAYSLVFIEKVLADQMKEEIHTIKDKVVVIDRCVKAEMDVNDIKVAFLASSDTHVAFMIKLARAIPNHIFLIPERSCKDDGAAAALEREGKPFIEIHYKATECRELTDFQPQFIYTATDWTSEFIAVQRIIQGTAIKTVALQEGPEDWHMKFLSNHQLKVLNHYRNADVFFSQGSRTMFFIRPQYFAITGSPKIDQVEDSPLPEKPKVLINCNFTYLSTKPPYESKREMWMESVLRVCKEIGIDYFISKHPRDDSVWDDPNLVHSNAYTIKQQIKECSISVSRFSSIPFETLAQSRKAIYYNVHLEPMPTFAEDTDSEVPVITEESELKSVLLEHKKNYPYKIDKKSNERYLTRHVGMQDGKALDRVIHTLLAIASNRWTGSNEVASVLEKMQELPASGKKKTFAIYFMPGQKTTGEYKSMMLAEALSALGHKVFILTDAYPSVYREFYEWENHKDIEFVLTKTFEEMLELDRIDYAVCICGEEETKRDYQNAEKLCRFHGAAALMLSGGCFAKSSLEAGILNGYRDCDLEQQVQLMIEKIQRTENILDIVTEIRNIF